MHAPFLHIWCEHTCVCSLRQLRLKHLLHVLGARSVDYFLAHLCCDFTLFALPIATALVVGAATHSPSFGGAFALAAAALMLGFAVAISTMTYIVSFLFTSSKSVLKYLSTILLFATTVPLCLLFSISVALPNTANAAALRVTTDDLPDSEVRLRAAEDAAEDALSKFDAAPLTGNYRGKAEAFRSALAAAEKELDAALETARTDGSDPDAAAAAEAELDAALADGSDGSNADDADDAYHD